MAVLDRATARALCEAGYMPLSRYIELFGDEAQRDCERVASPSTAPEAHEYEAKATKDHAKIYHAKIPH